MRELTYAKGGVGFKLFLRRRCTTEAAGALLTDDNCATPLCTNVNIAAADRSSGTPS